MDAKLEKLLKSQRLLWRGKEGLYQTTSSISTGFAQLDAVLPSRGWPRDALLEIITRQWGIGELRLLLPAMMEISRQGLWIVWIAPPYLPYAPALLEGGVDLSHTLVINPKNDAHADLWGMEKILRTQACGMVLAWPKRLAGHAVRRLQLAAEAGSSLGVLFRHTESPSAAALRIRLQSHAGMLRVDIIKARGSNRPATVSLRP
jgi:hypothetical protein